MSVLEHLRINMSVLDRLTQIQTYWELAIGAGFVFFLLTIIIGMILVCVIKSIDADKAFSAISIISIIWAGAIVISIAGLVISTGQVSKTRYYPDKYNIEQMAIDYKARTIEDDQEHKPYLVHYEGYGAEEWVYYVGKPDPQAQYLIQES